MISLREEKYKIHLLCSKFEDKDGIIKPAGIKKLIKWSLDNKTIEGRIITHGYNHKTGIIPKKDRLNTLEIILNEFLK